MRLKINLMVMGIMVFVLGCGNNSKIQTLKFSGTLELTEHALGAKVSGQVASLSVDEGDTIQQGQVLATLDRYEQTKKDYERILNLFKEGGATQQSVEYSQLSMNDQEIVSSVNGVVLVKIHEVGETVSAGSPIVVVGDRSQLWVKVFVPEGQINRIQMGQPATLTFDGLKNSFKGHVSFIASQAEFTPRNVQTQEERITQAFAVKIILDDVKPYLRPGVVADVVIQTQ